MVNHVFTFYIRCFYRHNIVLVLAIQKHIKLYTKDAWRWLAANIITAKLSLPKNMQHMMLKYI